jgi:hypothetical protein
MGRRTLGPGLVAMYIQLLSAVLLPDTAEAGTPAQLLTWARLCRQQMLTSADHARSSAERDLSYDVNYDCALIRLCLAVGLPATPAAFGRPRDERVRLERALAEAGFDLVTADLVTADCDQ